MGLFSRRKDPDKLFTEGERHNRAKQHTEALRCYEQAAELGHAEAQYKTAWLYENGKGCERNHAQAIFWYKKAMEQGHLSAKSSLAFMYCWGRGVGRDYAKAYELFTDAAEHDNGMAQYGLAMMYKDGTGVAQDLDKAYYWAEKSRKNNTYIAVRLMEEINAMQRQRGGAGLRSVMNAPAAGISSAGIVENLLNVAAGTANAGRQEAKAEPVRTVKADPEKLYEQGTRHHENKEYAAMIRCFSEAAEMGHMRAQKDLAWCYENGLGVERDKNEALYWMYRAINSGAKGGHLELACYYVMQNDEEFRREFMTVYEMSIATAQKVLEGLPYLVDKEKREIFELFHRFRIKNRKGMEPRRAAAPPPKAQAAPLTDEQAAQLSEKGRQLYEAERYPEALHALLQAAAHGNAEDQYLAATMYYEGRGTAVDYTKAVYWYEKAAERGISFAQYELACMLYHGEGVEIDADKAFAWALKAAELDDEDVSEGALELMYTIARMVRKGEGVPQDLKKAAAWFEKAARLGEASAQFSLGQMYAEGQGVERDIDKARQWLTKASAAGVTGADAALARLDKGADEARGASQGKPGGCCKTTD